MQESTFLHYVSLLQCKNKYQEIKIDPLHEISSLVNTGTLATEKEGQENVKSLNSF